MITRALEPVRRPNPSDARTGAHGTRRADARDNGRADARDNGRARG
ncbi:MULTISPECIES: hypothetical protein [unclassified Streptomyces]|nr:MULTISPECIES: hypothetical protein [unclassified Streptomyces]MYQ54989.1 hypothetical protein [Streptomyces sp. SID4941]